MIEDIEGRNVSYTYSGGKLSRIVRKRGTYIKL